MGDPPDNAVSSALAWLARRPGYMLLTARDSRLSAEPPERFAHAWIGLMGASLVWGLLLVSLWGVAWRIFQDYALLIMPAATAASVYCLWPLRRAAVSLAAVLAGRDPAARAVAASVVVLVLTLCFIRLYSPYERFELWWIKQLLPGEKLYRVLVLMPLWGAWSMVIAVKFCRPTDRTEPQVAAFARGCGAAAAAGCMAVLLAGSLVCFHHLGTGSQVAITLVTAGGAIAGGVGLCRLTGGPSRTALLAASALTQIVFVMAYLAGREFRL